MPQSLAYCRALSANKENISDFFGKLGAIYGKLNVISKPMQIFNADETGVTIVHRPGKVIAELGRHNVYTITSAERGKTHTILSCVSASALVLPPCLVFPRKRKVPNHLREGAVPGTLFNNTESGWMSKEVYLEWFKFFSKACAMYMAKNPGRVITTDVIASLIGSAWPSSHTPVNIMSGFRKSDIYPLNPGAIDDRDLAPSKAFQCPKKTNSDEGVKEQSSSDGVVTKNPAAVVDCELQQPSDDLAIKLTNLQLDDVQSDDLLFTPEQERLYEQRFQEGYDLKDPNYEAWVRINHPSDANSECCYSNSLSVESQSATLSSSVKASDSSAVLSEVLVLPKPKETVKKRKRKEALNKSAVCITDIEVLEKIKSQEAAKVAEQQAKEARRLEREKKKAEGEEKKKAKEAEKERKKMERKRKLQKKPEKRKSKVKCGKSQQKKGMSMVNNEENSTKVEDDEDSAICPMCGFVYPDEGDVWVCCDSCEVWYDLKCTGYTREEQIPDLYYCFKCQV